ncbi:hypothetical protein E3Q22_00181 [Wallemia mellicola]|uniref:NAD(P)-binding protein n=1 Tax=Wallemia mellicola TaxID=1708541 RepID=A0A4T0SXM7_9BASI|nr:hypothetical protein E3Q22_00181 [Wallemia mellicola]TIC37011.1 hypothetical protein E3Q09_01056 [Wallemia mellicola]TIC56846.1 hypothetical protein E3Q04_00844 [Wallemia mellicola]
MSYPIPIHIGLDNLTWGALIQTYRRCLLSMSSRYLCIFRINSTLKKYFHSNLWSWRCWKTDSDEYHRSWRLCRYIGHCRTKAGEEATKNINADKAAYVQTDITSEESVKNAMKVASNAFEKRLSGLVHCAGVAMSQPWTNRLEDTIGRSRRLLEINYMGTYDYKRFIR